MYFLMYGNPPVRICASPLLAAMTESTLLRVSYSDTFVLMVPVMAAEVMSDDMTISRAKSFASMSCLRLSRPSADSGILSMSGSTTIIPSMPSIFLAVKRELTVPIPSIREKALSISLTCLRSPGLRIVVSVNNTMIISWTPNSFSMESLVTLESMCSGI
ncbi:MAG: hypothetical protein BWY89_01554 [Bacteroidetes bacterium ADurb.BinA012]|nr:MAG: hypothetical protein BWY89_01554 [Bacteroidetes bacterium ADurb.BinA012]